LRNEQFVLIRKWRTVSETNKTQKNTQADDLKPCAHQIGHRSNPIVIRHSGFVIFPAR
jgi:hypothetical protein